MNSFIEFFRTAFNSSDSMIIIIVWGIFLGMIAGIAVSLVTRTYSHKLVSALVRERAADPSTARSFEQLGMKKNLVYKVILHKDAPLKKYIKYNGSEMYLPEEMRLGAEVRFSQERHPVLTFVAAIIILFVVAVFATAYIPRLISAYAQIGK